MSQHNRIILWLVLFLISNQCGQTKQAEIFNVALGKPTQQNSDDKNPGYSSLAVDGNRNPIFEEGSCTLTHKESLNNFWMVDLLCFYRIHSISITNRDKKSNRLKNFFIYVSDEYPSSIPLPNGEFKGELCLHHSGELPKKGPHPIQCSSQDLWGRYVYLWKPGNEQLSLCEFEVYVESLWQSQMKLSNFQGRKSDTPPFFNYTMPSYSRLDCVVRCLASDVGCATVVQVEKDTNRCECIEENGLEGSAIEVNDAGWTLMRSFHCSRN